MKYTAIIQGERVAVEFNRTDSTIEARIDDRNYKLEATAVEPGVFWFNWENRSIEIAVTARGEAYTASIHHHEFSVELLDTRAALRKAAQQSHDGAMEVRAPMPGKIVRVLAEEGAEVKANQGLVVMEAMKMQNEIKSPKAGTVRKVAVVEGMAVNAGDLLISVE